MLYYTSGQKTRLVGIFALIILLRLVWGEQSKYRVNKKNLIDEDECFHVNSIKRNYLILPFNFYNENVDKSKIFEGHYHFKHLAHLAHFQSCNDQLNNKF